VCQAKSPRTPKISQTNRQEHQKLKITQNKKKKQRKRMLSQIFKRKFSISTIIVPGNGAKNLIARKCIGVAV